MKNPDRSMKSLWLLVGLVIPILVFVVFGDQYYKKQVTEYSKTAMTNEFTTEELDQFIIDLNHVEEKLKTEELSPGYKKMAEAQRDALCIVLGLPLRN